MRIRDRLKRLVEDWIGPILIALFLFGFGCFFAGCVSASPERQAHRATATVITTANAAMDVWFAHVAAEERAIETLKTSDPAAFMARRRALVLAEGKVATVWDTYVQAQKAMILGAAAAGPGAAPTTADVDRLKAEVISLVQSLIR
jgi:hypothetical protein